MKNDRSQLSRRIDRHREFYSRRAAGDLLVYINGCRTPSLEGFLCRRLHEQEPGAVIEPQAVRLAIREYVASLRASYDRFYSIADDSVPSAIVYWGIGSITAAMTEGTPVHDGTTSWLEPNLPWPEVDALEFDPENKWLRFAVEVNKALWENWDHDFMILPYLHRSPLDAANGIRGTDLFLDMYEHLPPEESRLKEPCDFYSLFQHYCSADLISAGATKEDMAALANRQLPLAERWARFRPFFSAIRGKPCCSPAHV